MITNVLNDNVEWKMRGRTNRRRKLYKSKIYTRGSTKAKSIFRESTILLINSLVFFLLIGKRRDRQNENVWDYPLMILFLLFRSQRYLFFFFINYFDGKTIPCSNFWPFIRPSLHFDIDIRSKSIFLMKTKKWIMDYELVLKKQITLTKIHVCSTKMVKASQCKFFLQILYCFTFCVQTVAHFF